MKKQRLLIRARIFVLSFLFFIILSNNLSFAQYEIVDAFPGLTFNNPVDFQCPDDGTNRVFVVEKTGKIFIVDTIDGDLSSKVFLDITDSVNSTGWEMGLLGLAFHPDFENNGYFFVDYTAGDIKSKISRFKVSSDPDSADIESEEVIMEIEQPTASHNGGQLRFGPDNYLYISKGDGGVPQDTAGNAQDLSVLLGKILRIDIDNQYPGLNYAIPPDNPFVDSANTRGEIYAYGFRNPWRFSFDNDGNIWCGDVGENHWEEIDIIQKGGNYGWNIMEGNHCFPPGSSCDSSGLIIPLHEYDHNTGNSITGGFVYYGNSMPQLKDKFIFGDFLSKKIWAFYYDENNPTDTTIELLGEAPGKINSFGVDQNNEIYICGYDNRNIYRIDATTDIKNENNVVKNFKLFQNYPNPFNPVTQIKYQIPHEGKVVLKIYNILGKEITTLVDEYKNAGSYKINFDASKYASSVYIYSIKVYDPSTNSGRSFVSSKKMILLK